MDQALRVPGVTNAWTMPVKGRIDMLTTGMRTPLGLKISGADLGKIEQIGTQLETVLGKVKGTRGVFAERTGTGYFLDFRMGPQPAGALRPKHRRRATGRGERHWRRGCHDRSRSDGNVIR